MLTSISDVDFNVLEWWKKNAIIYPVFSKIAQDILTMPVTIVSSEATFSTSGRIVDQHRSQLSPSTIETLTYIQDWFQKNYYIDILILNLYLASSSLLCIYWITALLLNFCHADEGVDSSSSSSLTNDEELIVECLG